MFGLWLNKRIYENLPPLFFFAGMIVLLLSFSIERVTAANLLGFSGLFQVMVALLILYRRNKNRHRLFKFQQLCSFNLGRVKPSRKNQIHRRLHVEDYLGK